MGTDALTETVMSVHSLRLVPARGLGTRPALGPWHRQYRAGAAARAGTLFDLVPGGGFTPDFLLHLPGDFDTAVGLATQTSTEQLAADIAQLPGRAHSRSLRELAEGSTAARESLAKDLRRYFDSCLTDLWPQIRAEAAADRALRSEALLRGGVDGLLATLSLRWHWDPPLLHIPSPCAAPDIEVPLCGRGLVLQPSYFGGPGLTVRPGEPTVLLYPIHTGEPPTECANALIPLLGRTRAAVLAAVRHPATTTAVAERAGISLPSASQHTTVLRNARLITTARAGSAVLHTLSPLGQALLHGDAATR
ncbi:ArsR family transcriptional regulator [Streptomyces sp. NPDC000987]|uniref:ArsR/SmtB family transcription factor n=1 Tax=Streptomyces sp. NPDC000987 TaxID=3154374 RepID=UPI00333028C0